MGDPLLALVAKAPVPGRVKTRFCPPLTPEAAADLYRAFLSDTVDLLLGARGVTPGVILPPGTDDPSLAGLLPAGLWVRRQQSPGLTDALGGTIAAGLAQGHDRVVIFGSDNPTLPAAYLDRAIASLETNDLVIGPATDGGYYLIGLNRPAPFLFEDMPWSTASIFSETIARARRAALRIGCLPPWYDIDRAEDLSFLAAHLAADAGIPAIATRRALAAQDWDHGQPTGVADAPDVAITRPLERRR